MPLFVLLPALVLLSVGVYLFFCLRRLLGFYGVPQGWRRQVPAALGAGLAVLSCRSIYSIGTLLVLHFFMLFVLTDLLAAVVRRLARRWAKGRAYRACRMAYRSGLAQLLAVAVLFGYGYYNIGHITQTHYTLTSDKLSEPCRILFLSDTHYGTIQDKALLTGQLTAFQAAKPDLVVLGGDLVDEQTSLEDMQQLFGLLGGLQSRWGTYYVYGNHDRQPYTNTPTFTPAQLQQAIEQNGIHILRDEVVELGDRLLLAGREDASYGRQPGGTLLQNADRGRYLIVADHQPRNLAENAALGVDLMLSGHTHGGQIWPLGVFIGLVQGYNYGLYQQGGCTLLLSSGFTGWGYPIRTEKHCEYLLVDLLPA